MVKMRNRPYSAQNSRWPPEINKLKRRILGDHFDVLFMKIRLIVLKKLIFQVFDKIGRYLPSMTGGATI